MKVVNFYELEPKQFLSLDLTLYSSDELQEIAYFIWTVHSAFEFLMTWRKEKLIPLIMIDTLDDDDDDDFL